MNTFVKYNNALGLKTLGFNEPCLFYFDRDGETISMSYQEESRDLNELQFVTNNDNLLLKLGRITAPTYEQAFRFLIAKVDSARYEISIDVHCWYLFDKVEVKHYADFIAVQKLIDIITSQDNN